MHQFCFKLNKIRERNFNISWRCCALFRSIYNSVSAFCLLLFSRQRSTCGHNVYNTGKELTCCWHCIMWSERCCVHWTWGSLRFQPFCVNLMGAGKDRLFACVFNFRDRNWRHFSTRISNPKEHIIAYWLRVLLLHWISIMAPFNNAQIIRIIKKEEWGNK